MSYVAPRFCADRVTPYPREGAILAQTVDHSNLQHNLFHPDLVFAKQSMERPFSKRTTRQTLNGCRLISVVDLATYQVTIGSGGLIHFTNGFPSR